MKDNKIKMTWTEFTRNYGLAQDTTTKYIVNNHIYYCQSGLVDDLLKRGFFDYEEITNYYEQEEDESGNYDTPKEIHEWWLVSDWLENKLKEVDDALSALVLDLDSEGLLDTTLIALVTEFGRTPKINVNDGRDHHPSCYSTVLIGAGVKGGYVAGETNKTASKVIKNPYTISDVNATIGRALGLPVEQEFLSPTGRPFYIAAKGTPIKEVLT